MRADYNYFRKLRDKFILFIRDPKRYPLKLDKVSSKFIEEVLRMLYVKLKTDPNKKQYDKFIRAAVSPFDRFTDNLQDEIIRVVRIGNKNESTVKEMTTALNRTIDRNKHRANNLIETTIGGVNRAKRMEEALEAGFEYFRYTGPAPEREFCEIHYGKIYHIDEIRKMDNEQKLPVEYFCGGYRCKHTWTVVTKKRAENAKKKPSEMRNRADAIKWAEDNIADTVDLPIFSKNQKNDLAILTEINETIEKLNQKYKLGKLSHLGSGIKNFRYYNKVSDMSNNACYVSAPDIKNQVPGDSFYIGKGTLKYLRTQYIKAAIKEGYKPEQYHSWFLSRNMEDLIVHEYGHRVHRKNSTFDKEIQKLYHDHFGGTTARGDSNYSEFFAELFSLDYHGTKINTESKALLTKIEASR